MKHLECIINSGLFNGVDKSEYIDTFEGLKVSSRRFEKDETIFFEGDLIDKICIIEAGTVRGEKTYDNGEIHIVNIYDTGELFALDVANSRSKVASLDFISNEETDVVFISVNSIERSSNVGKIKQEIMFKLADSNIKMSNKAEILAERGLRDRILAYFNILDKKSKGRPFSIKMNREQMAQYLCVNRSALSNELNKMKREGIISFNRDKFELKTRPS